MMRTGNRYPVIAVLALVLAGLLLPGTARALSDVDAYNATICNPVFTESSMVPVITESSGIYVVHKDSYSCPPQVAQAPIPPPPPPRTNFLVFFDWDKSIITPTAGRVLDDAAMAAQQVRTVRIDVTGHADSSGSMTYNQRLSERRAAAVKAELVRRGIDPQSITTLGKGETDLLVPTRDGVREPSNRRAQIVIVTN